MSAQDEAGASSAEEKPAYTYAPYTGGNAIVSAYWVERYERDAARYWDLFYRRNADHFFKDRHYLEEEWPQLKGSAEDEAPQRRGEAREADGAEGAARQGEAVAEAVEHGGAVT